MGFFSDSFRALGTTLRNFLRPPVTIEYPTVVRSRPERHRVSFALLIDETGDEACIGCLQCERICPSQVIAIKQAPKRESKVTGKKRGYAEDFTLDLEACIFCELCVQVCPTDAIVMCRAPEQPGYCREDLVLTMDKLYENQKLKPLSWGTGGKLMEMQDPARGKPKPAEAAGDDKAGEPGAEKPKKVVKPKAAKAAAEPAKESAPAKDPAVAAEPAKESVSAKESAPAKDTTAKAESAKEPAPATDAKPETGKEAAAKETAPVAQASAAAEPKTDGKEAP